MLLVVMTHFEVSMLSNEHEFIFVTHSDNNPAPEEVTEANENPLMAGCS